MEHGRQEDEQEEDELGLKSVRVKTEPTVAEEDGTKSAFTIAEEYERSQLPDLLRVYYTRIFPYDKYFRWLQYGSQDTFSHREFSFTLKDDVYVRYQSFDSQQALEEGIKKTMPYKIDIGAIFSVKPSMKNRVQQSNFRPMRKELVFDIDMTDYDDIRTCCQEANICNSCWTFMKIAIRIIDRALREDFGFKHLLWVYSGRRGVHCWVCDETALNLSPEVRSAIVEYLSLIKGGEQQAQKVSIRSPPHPSIQSAEKIVDLYFKTLCNEQGFLSSPDQWKKVLDLVPKNIAAELKQEWQDIPTTSSFNRWGRLKYELEKKKHQKLLLEIKLQWSYPRLDVNVSKGINHLLKSPLCVHPKTGRVCVPIDPAGVDSFDPFSVPTVSKICHEFETVFADKTQNKSQKQAYMKTSLKPYMEFFQKNFLLPLFKQANKKKREEETMEF